MANLTRPYLNESKNSFPSHWAAPRLRASGSALALAPCLATFGGRPRS